LRIVVSKGKKTMRWPALFLAMLMVCVGLGASGAEGVGWQEAVARLTYERSQVKICVAILKKYDSKPAKDRGALVYDEAKAEYDAVIAGLIVALAEGQRPVSLPDLEERLQRGFEKRTSFCESARAVMPPPPTGQKGPVDEIVKAMVEPLADAVSAIWRWKMDANTQIKDTIKLQLEDAKWPSFESV
jgi:hypothetical protein